MSNTNTNGSEVTETLSDLEEFILKNNSEGGFAHETDDGYNYLIGKPDGTEALVSEGDDGKIIEIKSSGKIHTPDNGMLYKFEGETSLIWSGQSDTTMFEDSEEYLENAPEDLSPEIFLFLGVAPEDSEVKIAQRGYEFVSCTEDNDRGLANIPLRYANDLAAAYESRDPRKIKEALGVADNWFRRAREGHFTPDEGDRAFASIVSSLGGQDAYDFCQEFDEEKAREEEEEEEEE
jgi:hypothetical protein